MLGETLRDCLRIKGCNRLSRKEVRTEAELSTCMQAPVCQRLLDKRLLDKCLHRVEVVSEVMVEVELGPAETK